MTQVGIIGAGNISETHARAAREINGVGIGAVYGTNQEKAARMAQLYGGAVYEDLETFLEHQPLDLVMIGSPSGLHAEQGIAADGRRSGGSPPLIARARGTLSVHPCRLTISSIQIGAKGDVHPLETG